MKGKIFNFKNVDEDNHEYCNENTLFKYLHRQERGIDYVEENSELSIAKDIRQYVEEQLDDYAEGIELKLKHGKCYIKIPTELFKEYAEREIRIYKERKENLTLQNELKKIHLDWDFQAEAGDEKTLGEFYGPLVVGKKNFPITFYTWALEQFKIAILNKKEFMEYEIIQTFDFHF